MRRYPLLDRIFGYLLDVLTVLSGIFLVATLFYPAILTWTGYNLVPDGPTGFARGGAAFLAWFIFGRDRITRMVSEINNSGPIAIAIVALIVLYVYTRNIYNVMITAGIFDDIAGSAVLLVILAAVAVWAYRTYRRRP